MRVLLYFLANKEVGLGHLYRMEALASALVDRGHRVFIASDRAVTWPGTLGFFAASMEDPERFEELLALTRPGWVVFDLPEKVPRKWIQAVRRYSAKVCLIDGRQRSDLMIISQGFGGRYCAPKYLLLRQNIQPYLGRWAGPGNPPLVWGGASDRMGLLLAFCKACPESDAVILFTQSDNDFPLPCVGRWVANATGEAMFGLLAGYGKLICAFGMICWEAAAVGVPQYVFSATERHLRSALLMQKAGYLLAWPKVGLPVSEQLAAFVETPFVPSGKPVDGLGAGRVVGLLEENS